MAEQDFEITIEEVDYRVRVSLHHQAWGAARKIRIVRLDGLEIKARWDVLQRIKNEALGPNVMAVEVYPPVDRLIDTTNMRHLWEVPFDARMPDLMR
jgi:hypothetical protein